MLLDRITRRGAFSGYPYLETTVVLAVYLLIGHAVDPQDPLLFDSSVAYLSILLTIVTLFHGLPSGLLAVAIVGGAMKYFYPDFDTLRLLGLLLLVLIDGEFRYMWRRKLEQEEVQLSYTRKKLEELSRAFYALKISHDQIEKSYVVKPMSLRNAIEIIKNDYYAGKRKEFYEKFLHMLKSNFHVEDARLLKVVSEKEFETLAVLGEVVVDRDDPMFQSALEKSLPIFVSDEDRYEKSRYLAVIPAMDERKINGILLIERMPFVSFQKNNLISIAILLDYLFREMHKMDTMERLGDFLPEFDREFRFEGHRLLQFQRIYGVDSSLLIFRSHDEVATHILNDAVQRKMRSLDLITHAKIAGVDVTMILFPLAPESAVEGFMKRMRPEIGDLLESHRVRSARFQLSQEKLIRKYIHGERG